MLILVDGLSSSISELAKHARFKRQHLSAVAPLCLISGNLSMSAAAWDDTPDHFPVGVTDDGVERDAHAITKARELAGGPTYVHADIRDYRPASGAFDVAIVMSQSFGTSIRQRTAMCLASWQWACEKAVASFSICGTSNSSPRIRASVNSRQLVDRFERGKRLNGDRLCVELDYPDGVHEEFEWQLFFAGANDRIRAVSWLGLVCSPAQTSTLRLRLSRQTAHPIRSRALGETMKDEE